MDEILASIRKIIAEEPPVKGAGDNGFAALAPSQASAVTGRGSPRSAGDPAGERSALMDRIARASRPAEGHAGTPPATAAGAGVVQSQPGTLEKFIESDLGDLLAEVPAAAPVAEPGRSGESRGVNGAASPAAVSAPASAFWPLPTSTVAAAVANERAEPTFSGLSQLAPSSRAPSSEPAVAADPFGAVVPSRFDARVDAGHGSPSVASRLPPLSGGAPAGGVTAFALPQTATLEHMPQSLVQAAPGSASVAAASSKERLAGANWSEMMRRAADAAEVPEVASSAPAGEPVVLAAMAAGTRPVGKAVPQPAPVAEPAQTSAAEPKQPVAPHEPKPVATPADAAASEPVVLAAMTPRPAATAAKPAPLPPATKASVAATADQPIAAVRQGLNGIARIDASAGEAPQPSAAPSTVRKDEPTVAAAPGSAPLTAAGAPSAPDAETDAAVASALGALAAGLAASSSKSVPAPAPLSVAAPAAAAKSEQPDVVKGLSIAAATRPDVLAPQGAPVAEAAVQGGASGRVAAPEPGKPSEAFLALSSGPSAPLRTTLPSVIGAHGLAEPESPLDDTVAELLRPMLRQWLSDNMPRIVEKALRIELAESLKYEHRGRAHEKD